MTDLDDCSASKKKDTSAKGAFADLLKSKYSGTAPTNQGGRPKNMPFVSNRGHVRSVNRGK